MIAPMPSSIPVAIREGIERYINERIPTGSFLAAVLENNLREAVQRADLESARALPEIVKWLCYNAPWSCWGTPDRVQMWLSGATRHDKITGFTTLTSETPE